MGGSSSTPVPPRKPVPTGKIRLCIAGYTISHHTGRSRKIIAVVAKKYPAQYESWMYFPSHKEFEAFCKTTFDPVPFPPHLKGHSTSPFCWTETTDAAGVTKINPIGGRDHLCGWVLAKFPSDEELKVLCTTAPSLLSEGMHNGKDAPQSTADVSL
jgi:hypothetical protein